ncbi:hypothetical protein [Burkholderia sp. WSM2232]|nr:hypothetical protein [Burkholderia sp. WSM2232]
MLFGPHIDIEGWTYVASVDIVSLPDTPGLAFSNEVYVSLERAIREFRL